MKVPDWIKEAIPRRKPSRELKKRFKSRQLHTVCEEAKCPNIGECFGKGTATFLIMGNICTRSCSFCAVKGGKPEELDENEPERVAGEVMNLGITHAVITSPSRDDLADGGAEHFRRTVRTIKEFNPDVTVEVLIPDFRGDKDSLKLVLDSGIDVLNHNVETVPRLYSEVRPQADYRCSLGILRFASEYSRELPIKSGIILGLGESREEILEVMDDLREAGCNLLTIGQYLRPSKELYPVKRYVTPDEFEELREAGVEKGFSHVASAPLVRSSYNAHEALKIYMREK